MTWLRHVVALWLHNQLACFHENQRNIQQTTDTEYPQYMLCVCVYVINVTHYFVDTLYTLGLGFKNFNWLWCYSIIWNWDLGQVGKRIDTHTQHRTQALFFFLTCIPSLLTCKIFSVQSAHNIMIYLIGSVSKSRSTSSQAGDWCSW